MSGFDRRAVSDPRQIRALSSAVRQEIVDTMAALGGSAAVADLAAQLGRPADGLYYHLRLLAHHGLIEECAGGPGKERRYRLAGRGSAPLRLAYRTGAADNLSALTGFARSLLQVAAHDFEEALDDSAAVLQGPRRELWTARNKGWVSAENLEEINALIERLNELVSQPSAPDRKRLITFSFVLAPVSPRPKRRGGAVG